MAKSTDLRRSKLGPHFSEGARLLWAAIESSGKPIRQVEREMGAHTGDGSRTLYGDRPPSLTFVLAAQAVFGIEPRTWKEKSRVKFLPPAARPKPRRRRAAAATGGEAA